MRVHRGEDSTGNLYNARNEDHLVLDCVVTRSLRSQVVFQEKKVQNAHANMKKLSDAE